MSTEPHRPRSLPIFLLAGFLGIVVFAVTEVAYIIVAAQAQPNYIPLGFIYLAMDINSYYSFIHQAADGFWTFRNDMTYLPCDRAFFNLQWLIVGKCEGWFHWSPQFTFKAWRFAGSIILMLGFASLAVVVLQKSWQRVTALMMCAFGGGLGWIGALFGVQTIVDNESNTLTQSPLIDLDKAVHPFGQILSNPHYSLPHGTFLIFIAFFLLGERSRKPVWYFAAAAMAIIQGLFRPYDLITICAMVSLFMLIEFALARDIDFRRGLLRALPVVVSLPLLAYYYYIFSVHPVFKYWASQGDQKPSSIFWHLVGLGLVGILVFWRMARFRKYPFATAAERLLLITAGTIFFLNHANSISTLLSFSPQIGIPLLTPLILLTVPMLPRLADACRITAPRWRAVALVAFLAVNAVGSLLLFQIRTEAGEEVTRNYITDTQLEAVDWLKNHTTRDDVVLSTENMGGRIAFLIPVRVALGHWALTPDVKWMRSHFKRFSEGDLSQRKAQDFLDEVKPRYIFIMHLKDTANKNKMARMKDPAPQSYFLRFRGVRLAFSNQDCSIYEIRANAAATSERLQ